MTQITPSNVSKLGIAWTQQQGKNLSMFENYPIVVNGVMYYTTDLDQVRAVNAATEKVIQQYTPKVNSYGSLAGGGGVNVNRGVAVANGKVYLAIFDAHLIALQAASGIPTTVDLSKGSIHIHRNSFAPKACGHLSARTSG